MPAQGIENVFHEDILSFEEITRIIQATTLVGVKKVRLTGGEPLVRREVNGLVAAIASLPGIDDLALTTNGIFLAEQAKKLKQAGLKRVNISLDSLHAGRYRYITRGGCLDKVWAGIEASLELGLHPVKLNTVLIRGFNDDEVVEVARLSLEKPLHVRFIELMPVGISQSWAGERFVPAKEIKGIIEEKLGRLNKVQKLTGSGPAHYYRLAGANGTIGFIPAVSDHFCEHCNRLRLTSTGGLRSCLYDEREIDVKSAVRGGASLQDLAELVTRSIQGKPKQHLMTSGWSKDKKMMFQIGG
jgi:cyclic pyranopterin phosphate synthase